MYIERGKKEFLLSTLVLYAKERNSEDLSIMCPVWYHYVIK